MPEWNDSQGHQLCGATCLHLIFSNSDAACSASCAAPFLLDRQSPAISLKLQQVSFEMEKPLIPLFFATNFLMFLGLLRWHCGAASIFVVRQGLLFLGKLNPCMSSQSHAGRAAACFANQVVARQSLQNDIALHGSKIKKHSSSHGLGEFGTKLCCQQSFWKH